MFKRKRMRATKDDILHYLKELKAENNAAKQQGMRAFVWEAESVI